MNPQLPRITELALGSLLLLTLGAPGWAKARFDDPEDSPLFADSMQKAFAQFASRDNDSLVARNTPGRGTLSASDIIVVEGTHWHNLRARATPAPGSGGSGKGPAPLSVTTDMTCAATCGQLTCAITCSQPTCGATCTKTCGGVTCFGLPTCGQPTCAGAPTCGGLPTCFPNYTCVPMPTCSPGPTCLGGTTCTAAQCPTTLSGVTVPQAGQIQMSFSSSASLQYTLQYSTDLSSNQWLVATNALGNGGTMTFFHTNNASRSFYRLLISQ